MMKQTAVTQVKKGLGNAGQAVIHQAGGVGQAIKHSAVGTAPAVLDMLSDNPQLSDSEENTAGDYQQQGVEKGKLGKYKEAIEDFTHAIGLNFSDGAAYKYRGQAYSKLGDAQAAITDFQKAAKLYQMQGNTKDYQETFSEIVLILLQMNPSLKPQTDRV